MTVPFSSLPLSPALLEVLTELHFEHMTPIQEQSIGVLLAGRDLIGQAQTGSGKTAAFALPILQRLALDVKSHTVQALVLCPTRELCAQVAREFRKLGRKLPGLQVVALAGGEPVSRQKEALKKGGHIFVATPGRLCDHLRRGLSLATAQVVVLDEADRMLDMGFEADVTEALQATPKKRQTIYFSATYPGSIEAMSKAHQNDPVHVKIEDSAANEISHYALELGATKRIDALFALLASLRPEAALVFCNLKATVDGVTESLLAAGVAAAAMHGDFEQNDRDRVLARFRNRSLRVLVATDVAARGLDISDLDLVVNFDMPQKAASYVHRVGRTGRAGKAGTAITFVDAREQRWRAALEAENADRLWPPWRPTSTVSEPLAQAAKMTTLHISAGRTDKIRPGDILGALTGEGGGLEGSAVGKIEIHDRFSYVAVASEHAERAIAGLTAARLKGRNVKVGGGK